MFSALRRKCAKLGAFTAQRKSFTRLHLGIPERDLPGGPAAKTPHFYCSGMYLVPVRELDGTSHGPAPPLKKDAQR